ncbi:MAG: hypothetical protein LWW86_01560 [Micrococcales bacterium]|nr:hypothetical protein [Micrococcales bacterium]
MSGSLIVVVIALVALGLTVAGLAYAVGLLRREGAPRGAGARALVLSVATPSLLALGLVATVAWGGDRGLAVAPLLAALVAVAAVAAVDLTWPHQQGSVRSARLGSRAVRPPRALWRLAGLGTALTGALVVVGGLTADADGRSLTIRTPMSSAGTSPYPGWHYGLPILLALLLLLAGAWLAARVIESRPAQPGADPAVDAALRAASMTRTLRAVASGTLLTAAPLTLLVGKALRGLTLDLVRMAEQNPGGTLPDRPWLAPVGAGLIGLALVLAVLGLAALLWRLPRPAPAAAAEAPASASATA